ncbi:MAG: methyltransferase [Polyangiaceae bacterium]|nr:methyltransferase [Polyangiaceae bacterium]
MEPEPLFDAALALLGEVGDIIAERVELPVEPAWCRARELGPFLRRLDDAALERAEREGLDALLVGDGDRPAQVPPALVALATRLRPLTALPPLVPDAGAGEAARSVGARKRAQLAALAALCGPLAARAERIVDVGAGRGHFTRLAAAEFDKPAVGLERDPARVARARALTGRADVRFEVVDVTAGTLALAPGDLAIGLHACGELGDELVRAAAAARVGLVLVGCCAQKIRGPARVALSRRGGGFALGREILGLGNLRPRAEGVESSLAECLASRERRYALRRLLLGRGLAVAAGAEMQGLNRRRARQPFAVLAADALGLRGLAPADAAELARHEAAARHEHGVIRRLSLPRALCGRLLEATIALDRACFLREQGLRARLGTLCSDAVTPRNLAVVAGPSREQ